MRYQRAQTVMFGITTLFISAATMLALILVSTVLPS